MTGIHHYARPGKRLSYSFPAQTPTFQVADVQNRTVIRRPAAKHHNGPRLACQRAQRFFNVLMSVGISHEQNVGSPEVLMTANTVVRAQMDHIQRYLAARKRREVRFDRVTEGKHPVTDFRGRLKQQPPGGSIEIAAADRNHVQNRIGDSRREPVDALKLLPRVDLGWLKDQVEKLRRFGNGAVNGIALEFRQEERERSGLEIDIKLNFIACDRM